jgi:hypothetical protein
VRQALGPTPTLSVATHRIQPLYPELVLPPLGPVFWSAQYYREVGQRVNQVALMPYDSALPLPSIYRLWTSFETIQVSRALAGTNVSVFIGVPTSEEETRTHHPNVENMLSGLEGVVDGLNDADAQPAAITGVAIYPEWETDANDWATYQRLWLGT